MNTRTPAIIIRHRPLGRVVAVSCVSLRCQPGPHPAAAVRSTPTTTPPTSPAARGGSSRGPAPTATAGLAASDSPRPTLRTPRPHRRPVASVSRRGAHCVASAPPLELRVRSHPLCPAATTERSSPTVLEPAFSAPCPHVSRPLPDIAVGTRVRCMASTAAVLGWARADATARGVGR